VVCWRELERADPTGVSDDLLERGAIRHVEDCDLGRGVYDEEKREARGVTLRADGSPPKKGKIVLLLFVGAWLSMW